MLYPQIRTNVAQMGTDVLSTDYTDYTDGCPQMRTDVAQMGKDCLSTDYTDYTDGLSTNEH